MLLLFLLTTVLGPNGYTLARSEIKIHAPGGAAPRVLARPGPVPILTI